MTWNARLIRREIVADNIVVLHFEKPPGFDFEAGQFCSVFVPDIGIHDKEGLKKLLSIASAPFEPELIFAARLTGSAFKQTLGRMPLKSSVGIDGPFGSFVLPGKTNQTVVFLAGGLGVVPFRSLIVQASHVRVQQKIVLFYSNRFAEEAVFLDELVAAGGEQSDITVVPTITRGAAPPGWPGLTGRITIDTIKARCGEWQDASYYIAGSPDMVDSMKTMLEQSGIGTARIKREIWAGDAA